MTSDLHSDAGDLVANHHADHAGFSGIKGYLMGLTMVAGRSPHGRLAAERTGLRSGEHVVDIGCGPGSATRVASSLGARVTAVDPSPELLRMARWTSRRAEIDWTLGVAEDLPVPDDDADVVWALATVHHWPDLEGGLAEVRRVLRPGGRFVAIERRTTPGATGLASHGWTDAQVERFAGDCRDAGFVDVEVTTHRRRPGLVAVTARTPE